MKYFILCLIGLTMAACSTKNCVNDRKFNGLKSEDGKMTRNAGELNMKKIKVAKPDGTLQCSQGKKIALDDMQKELKEIHVFSAAASQNDGMMRIQVCGSPTGNHHVFEILETDLEKATSYGFKRWNR